MFWAWIPLLLQVSELVFSLDGVYHLGYLYDMCSEYDYIDGYRCRHKNA
jgi:hypothetical protein